MCYMCNTHPNPRHETARLDKRFLNDAKELPQNNETNEWSCFKTYLGIGFGFLLARNPPMPLGFKTQLHSFVSLLWGSSFATIRKPITIELEPPSGRTVWQAVLA